MVIILYLIVGLLFAILNHRTVAELVDERSRDIQMDEGYANALMHVALISLALLWPFYVIAFLINFTKHLIKGGNEK